MNHCHDIEPLLLLHREGERTPEQDAVVKAHLNTCAQCTGIMQSLARMDGALSQIRSAVLAPPNDRILTERTLAVLGRAGQQPGIRLGGFLERILSWSQPAFATVAATLLCFFIIQVTRDAFTISSLEHRLQPSLTSPAHSSMMYGEIMELLDSPPTAMGEDQIRALGTVLTGLTGPRDDLFSQLARRYPNIARVTFHDGLDEYERSVLATEGPSLRKDLELLLTKGESL